MVLVGSETPLQFSMYPRMESVEGTKEDGSSEPKGFAVPTPVTPMDVITVNYVVEGNFTWGLSLKNGTYSCTSVEHTVCATSPPAAPTALTIENNVATATVADFGRSCAPGGNDAAAHTVSFWYAEPTATLVTSARPLGTAAATGADGRAQLTVPASVAAGEWAFFAVACAAGLCGPAARATATVQALTPCTPRDLAVTGDGATGAAQVAWACDADPSAFTVHVAPSLDGPFAALDPVLGTARAAPLPAAHAFGAFYYYVEATLGGRTAASEVHTYALRGATRPGAVTAVWPPSGAVLPADAAEVAVHYRAASWGTTAGAATDPAALQYTVASTGGCGGVLTTTEQHATVSLEAGAATHEVRLSAANGGAAGASATTTVTYTTCAEAREIALADVVLAASETGDQVTVRWTVAGAPVFCAALPGAHGYRVEVHNGTAYALVAWVGDPVQRAAAFPFPARGWYRARVTAYAGERTVAEAASAPVELRSGNQDRVCDAQALALADVRAAQVADAASYPRPVRVSWAPVAFAPTCAAKGYEVRLDGRTLAVLKEDATAFVVPSAALPRTPRTVTLTVVARTETSTAAQNVSLAIADVAPVPFVTLRSPRNSAWAAESSTASITYEWDPIASDAGDEGAYRYELFVGSDPAALALVGTYAEPHATVALAHAGATHWAVRACETKTGFCGALATPFVHYSCAAAALAPVGALSVSPNVPPVVAWAPTPFGRDCAVADSSANAGGPARGWYNLTVVAAATGAPVLDATLLPSATAHVLPGLVPGERYTVTLRKCAAADACVSASTAFEAAASDTPRVGALEATRTGRSSSSDGSGAARTVLTNTTRLRWTVADWGRACTAGSGCEARVWLRANGADTWTLVGTVPFANDTSEQNEQTYELALTDSMYLQSQRAVAWAVAVDNGSNQTVEVAAGTPDLCRPHRPAQLQLLAPASTNSNNPKTNVFAVAPLAVWGDCGIVLDDDTSTSSSGDSNNNTYTFHATAAQDQSHHKTNTTRAADMRADAATGAVGMVNTLEYMTWRWTMYATNSFGFRGDAAPTFYYVSCEVEPPNRPEWTGNFSASTFDGEFSSSSSSSEEGEGSGATESQLAEPLLVSPHLVNLTWTPFDKSSFGQFCQSGSSMSVNSLVLYMSTDGMASWHVVEEVTFDAYRVVRPAGSGTGTGTGTAAPAWPKSVPLYFYLNASNNAAFTLSRVLKVVTLARSCADVACTQDQGECDLATAQCVCFAGYSGELCDRNLGREKNVKIAVGVAVGGALLLAIIAVVVVLLVKKFYRKHKALMMKPPDFEALRAPPVRPPAFAPDIDAPSDLSVLEAALLSETGFQMVWGLLCHTSATEIDTMAKALVYFYQHHNKGLELQMFLIMCEISSSATSTVLFRANSAATRAFKFYSKMYALPYLYRTLAVLLQGLIRDVDDAEEEEQQQGGGGNGGNGGNGGGADGSSSSSAAAGAPGATLSQFGDGTVDDDNACSDESINFLKLQLMCQKFFIQIMRSDKACPGELKHICAFLQSQLEQRFPDFVFKGIGAFMFLRFYNTAITVPETYGLLPSAPRPSVRKQLLLVSKVLQNLANGVLFGEKEPNMVRLNSFITQQRPAYEQFLRRLCDNQAPLSDPVPISDDSYNASLAIILNQFFIITRNNPELLDQLDCVPPELAELVRNARKDKKKKKDPTAAADPAAAAGLLDAAPSQESNPTTTTTTTPAQ